MIGDRDFEGPTGAVASPWDLEQIRDAVSALRASCPDSALADLVEEKIRLMENARQAPRPDFAASRAAAGGR